MEFKEKYTTAELVTKDSKESTKIVLSSDAYAVGEMLQKLIEQLSFRMGRL